MLCPPEHRFPFFLYVIESPSPLDLYHRRAESGLVSQVAALNRLECVTRTAISIDAFVAALQVGLPEAMALVPDRTPILHLSAHGWREGIELSDKTKIRWHELKELLKPINVALQNKLVVCMSSCEGYSGQRMAMFAEDGDEYPFFALIGCAGKPTWSETAIGYATLYHQLHVGAYVADAVAAMRAASGNMNFYVIHCEQARQGYLDFLASEDVRQAQEALAEDAEDHPDMKAFWNRILESSASS